MNYSEMSDYQINILVCKALGKGMSDYCRIMAMNDHTILLADNKTLFDPCNSWADAGPIIEKNHIDLIWYELDACWGAHKGMPCAYDHRPLRAAMIVFLMMNESKKEGGF